MLSPLTGRVAQPGGAAVEVGGLVGVDSLDVHLVGLGGLLQLGQDLPAAALRRRVHFENLEGGGWVGRHVFTKMLSRN